MISKLKNEVTFFYSTIDEKQIFEYLALELNKRRFKCVFTKNLKKKAEIGFYCQNNSNPNNSQISIILLGGLDQGRMIWPNIWKEQPWNKFDLGFLPGKNWVKRWKKSSHDFRSRTKFGVYNVGWPKADFLFDKKVNSLENIKIQKKYNLNRKKTYILYAPSFECFERQLDVTNAVKKNGHYLLIKHWLTKKEIVYQDLWDNIVQSNRKTKKIYGKKAVIIEPKENFLTLLNFCDLVITDESSVAYEALLRNIPTLSVKDWKIQRHKKAVTRLVKPAKITFKTTKGKLDKSIKKILNTNTEKKLKTLLDKEISYLGDSSKIIAELLERFIENRKSIYNSKYLLKPDSKNFLDHVRKFLR